MEHQQIKGFLNLYIHRTAFVIVAILLSACGGGSTSTPTPTPPTFVGEECEFDVKNTKNLIFGKKSRRNLFLQGGSRT